MIFLKDVLREKGGMQTQSVVDRAIARHEARQTAGSSGSSRPDREKEELKDKVDELELTTRALRVTMTGNKERLDENDKDTFFIENAFKWLIKEQKLGLRWAEFRASSKSEEIRSRYLTDGEINTHLTNGLFDSEKR